MEFFNPARLRRARRQKRLSVQQAATIINKDRSAIWRYETGQTDIPVSVLLALLNAYKASVLDVFDAGNIRGE